MARNSKLSQAKNAKNDEFYTQWADIEKEVQAYLEFDPDVFKGKTILCPCDDPYESNFFKYFALNFNDFKLKKLIATCYVNSPIANTQLSLFAHEPVNDRTTKAPHKIEVIEVDDYNRDGVFDLTDIEWILENKKNALTRLEGDGDFRSDEVTKLRDEADIIITNPPFSLFRLFLKWIVVAGKQFLIIGNMNAITYKEVFPLIKDNKMWLGATGNGNDMVFAVPKGAMVAEKDREKAARLGYVGDYTRLGNSCWFTNLDHGRRHQPISFMTMVDNLRHSKHKEIKGKKNYDKYDNYDAIEIPFADAIPSDYDGIMGVPISFLDKYCPEQFEILGATQRGCHDAIPDTKKYDDYWEVKPDGTPTGSSGGKTNENANLVGNDGKKNYFINKKGRTVQSAYQRIFIKHKRG